jgi:hypothetical protein
VKKSIASAPIENCELTPNKQNSPGNDFNFIVWKAELNKELMSFWKSILEANSEHKDSSAKK